MTDNFEHSFEPMGIDFICQGCKGLCQDADEALLCLSLKWSDCPQKRRGDLERSLQTWLNKNTSKLTCSVTRILTDGSAVIKIKPAPGLSDLQKLNHLTLTTKAGNTVTIMSVSLAPLEPTSPDVYEDESQGSCCLTVFHFWYVNQIYKEKIKHIERKNGVKTVAQVKVTFEDDGEDGSPRKALSEFTNLVQSSLAEVKGSVIPLKFVDPDQWSDALKVIQKSENKLLLLLSSEEVTVGGPSQSQEVFSATLNAMQKTDTSLKEHELTPEDASLTTGMAIKDPSTDAGLTTQESCSTLGTQVPTVKAKYNVDSKINQDKVDIKASYQGCDGNASNSPSEHQYKETTTSAKRYIQPIGLIGFAHSRRKSTGRHWNICQTLQNPQAHPGVGATAKGSKDETCPICMNLFTNKKQLKCKHEFCEECLQSAEKFNGPICPVCKYVFGVIKGDQPDGTMTWTKKPSSLPGFEGCGHIEITYNIPGGIQTEKHPKPGQPYSSTTRLAFLPDNKVGNEVLQLLKKAFDQKLIFTVGTSMTTGIENQVTWNDISHKTFISGGPKCFGYPDPDYLEKVKTELKAKGVE